MKVRRSLWPWGVSAALLIAAALVLAPYFDAGRYGERIRSSLEAALGRRVEVGQTRFRLFPGPGFILENVVIHDIPEAGLEPLAYVPALRADIRLRALWARRPQLAGLRLTEPSVNLVKTRTGQWNFQDLLARAVAAKLPKISVGRARIYLKFGDVKSVYRFSDAAVTLEPLGPANAFRLQFDGVPSRTDRPSHGFGRITGESVWRPLSRPGAPLQLSLRVDRSELAEISFLLYGYDSGWHGHVTANLWASGSLTQLEFRGKATVDDLHWWDAMPPYAEAIPLTLTGRLDTETQRVELEASSRLAGAVSVRWRLSNYLRRPRWALVASAEGLEVGPLISIARRAGAAVGELKVEGRLAGAVGYSPEIGWQGRLLLEGGRWTGDGGLVMTAPQLELTLNQATFQILPSTLRAGPGQTAVIQGTVMLPGFGTDLRITASGLSVAQSLAPPSPLAALAQLPLLSRIEQGTWSGTLHRRRDPGNAAVWSGTMELKDARMSLPALASPIEELTGRIVIGHGAVRLERARARLGEQEIHGSYSFQPDRPRPHHFRARFGELTGAELERFLAPLFPQPRGLLARALRLTRERLPPWLRPWRATAEIEVGSLRLAGAEFQNVRARAFWDGDRVEITSLSAHVEQGKFEGYLRAGLSPPRPSLEVGGRFQGVRWHSAILEGDGLLRTSGVGPELLSNLVATGSFQAQELELTAEAYFRTASGCYDFAWRRGKPHLKLTCLRLAAPPEIWLGQGETDREGRLVVALVRGREQLRLSGPLSPLRLEIVSAQATAPTSPDGTMR
ncbi:MAG: AsmA family protein [Bryobacteraceae bacterium]|nr:AsmA family protein [Bryobacteraceae bacterium]